jgi:hypothetical protein
MPYLLTGGVLGMAFVVFGSAYLLVQNARQDRARLEAKLDRSSACSPRCPRPAPLRCPRRRVRPGRRRPARATTCPAAASVDGREAPPPYTWTPAE